MSGHHGAGSGMEVGAAPAGFNVTEGQNYDLLFMRQEEKLSRDVYHAFSEIYENAQVFSNIACAEQRHMDSVLSVLDYFGLADNLAGAYNRGQFPDDTFNQLFAYLVDKGNTELAQALRVGVVIEVLDIADLEEAIMSTDDNEVLTQLYRNLLLASNNHLEAFLTNLISQEGGLTSADDYRTDAEIQTMLEKAMQLV